MLATSFIIHLDVQRLHLITKWILKQALYSPRNVPSIRRFLESYLVYYYNYNIQTCSLVKDDNSGNIWFPLSGCTDDNCKPQVSLKIMFETLVDMPTLGPLRVSLFLRAQRFRDAHKKKSRSIRSRPRIGLRIIMTIQKLSRFFATNQLFKAVTNYACKNFGAWLFFTTISHKYANININILCFLCLDYF